MCIYSYEDTGIKAATFLASSCSLFLQKIKAIHKQGYGSYIPVDNAILSKHYRSK